MKMSPKTDKVAKEREYPDTFRTFVKSLLSNTEPKYQNFSFLRNSRFCCLVL